MAMDPEPPVERLFPFALRARILLIGREILRRSKRHLQFVLITTDISDNSREEILRDFAHYPIVQRYTSAEIEQFFRVRGAKVLGFKKSGLAKSLYTGLKSCRINLPRPPQATPDPGPKPHPDLPKPDREAK